VVCSELNSVLSRAPERVVGTTALGVTTRTFGILLAALAAEMILQGMAFARAGRFARLGAWHPRSHACVRGPGYAS